MKSIKNCLLFLSLLMIVSQGIAQHKTYLGLEFGPKYEVMQVATADQSIQRKPHNSGATGGVSLGQELGKNWMVETGIYAYEYHHGVGIANAYVSSPTYSTFQVPLRVKYGINLIGDRLQITPSAGMAWTVDTKVRGSSPQAYTGTENQDGLGMRFNIPGELQSNRFLAKAGVTLGWKLRSRLVVYYTANYVKGFKQVAELNVEYWDQNQPSKFTTVRFNGSYLNSMLGLKFPISQIWQH